MWFWKCASCGYRSGYKPNSKLPKRQLFKRKCSQCGNEMFLKGDDTAGMRKYRKKATGHEI